MITSCCSIYLCAPLDQNFDFTRFIARNDSHGREVCGRHELSPGRYCVVVFARGADEEAEFILRFFSEKPVNSKWVLPSDGVLRPCIGLETFSRPKTWSLRIGIKPCGFGLDLNTLVLVLLWVSSLWSWSWDFGLGLLCVIADIQ